MRIPFGELRTQFEDIEGEVRAAMDRVLSRAWYVLGEEVAAFEAEFAAWNGAAHCVAVGSGTEAIHLALMAVGVEPGDAVVTAPNTCVPTVAAVSAAGAWPLLVDVDPATLTLDPNRLEAAITPEVNAIVPVHLYGHPCDMDAILAVAARQGVPVVEDCAQAHGALYKGSKCGCFGEAAAFSFYPSKNLGAFGDGGAVLTNDPALADRLRMLRNYGQRERYTHAVKGVNSRLDELQAAILRAKLPHLDTWNAARAERARAYHEALADLPVQLPEAAPWATPNHHLYVIRTAARDELQAHLTAEGIGALLHYPIPIHRQPAYADLELGVGAFPVAEAACNTVLSLPLYPELPLEHVKEVADAVRRFFRK